jgi:hypothetical protein
VSAEADLASVRRGFDLFNAGDLETLFSEVFHSEIDYHGDPNISVLTGLPVDLKGSEGVSRAWQAFFDMFDQVRVEGIELEADPDGSVRGTGQMLARGGVSKVPIDAAFHFAWVLEDNRWRFFAVETDQAGVDRAHREWLEANRGAD